MPTKHRSVILISAVVICLCPALLLLSSIFYKTSIGYTRAREAMLRVPPYKVSPLRVSKLPAFDGRLTRVAGLPVPADWSPKPHDEENSADGFYRVRMQHPTSGECVVTVIPLPNGLVEDYSQFQDNVESNVEKHWGSWRQFVSSYPDDRAALQSVYAAQLPQFADSSVWPLFPPDKDYMKDATLLAAKARQSAHGRFLHLTGQHLYFFVRLDEENSEAGMIVGREDNGMVVAEFGLRGNRISENLVQRFCASVDAGRFEPE